MKHYSVKLKSDSGFHRIYTVAKSKEAAESIVMKAENCPPSAIISIDRLPFNPTNIIGTDLSLVECVREGYWMLDTEGHESFDPNYQYNVFRYFPAYIKGTPTVLETKSINWEQVAERYTKYKSKIDRFADDMPAVMDTPNFHNLLNAVDTINAYCGID